MSAFLPHGLAIYVHLCKNRGAQLEGWHRWIQMNVGDHLTPKNKISPTFGILYYIFFACREIMKNIPEYEIVVGGIP